MTSDRPEVLVLGAGSIGFRHARNLAAAGASVVIADPDPRRANAAGADEVVAFDEVWRRDYDGVLVASPTRDHAADVRAAIDHAPFVLVEKPLAVSLAEARQLLGGGIENRVAVACNLRFHAPVQRLVDAVAGGAVGAVRSVRVWFGSWLPSWRPNVDYRDTYSARRELGGGVLLDAIHELDLLPWLFDGAELDVVGAIVDRIGPLDIDVEDTAVALLRGPDGCVVSLSLDYLSRRYRRGIEVVGDAATARLDWASATMVVEDADDVRSITDEEPIDVSYEREASAFVDWIQGGPTMPVDAATGVAAVALADAIAKASTWT